MATDDAMDDEETGELDEVEAGPDVDDLDDADEELAVVDDEEIAEDDDEDDDEDGDDDTASTTRVRKRGDDDDDEEMLAPDDVEADLDRILKDRMVATEEEGDDEEIEPGERGESTDRLQPKRADEQLCPSCFLLVRATAPACPVGDDGCPIFSA